MPDVRHDIGPKLSELALEILEAAKGAEVPFELKLESFKILTAYHVGVTRVSGKGKGEIDPDDGNFEAFRLRLRVAEGKSGNGSDDTPTAD